MEEAIETSVCVVAAVPDVGSWFATSVRGSVEGFNFGELHSAVQEDSPGSSITVSSPPSSPSRFSAEIGPSNSPHRKKRKHRASKKKKKPLDPVDSVDDSCDPYQKNELPIVNGRAWQEDSPGSSITVSSPDASNIGLEEKRYLFSAEGLQKCNRLLHPGNKTVHLAALMKRKGRIIACELKKEKIKRLNGTIKLSGVSNIQYCVYNNQEAFQPIDPSYSKLKAILLDPSYSDSALQHAFFVIPALERIVYSTCSINQIENEDVVKFVLSIAESYGFQLAKPFPEWHVLVFQSLKALKIWFEQILPSTERVSSHTTSYFICCIQLPLSGRVYATGLGNVPCE
ncbi:unnamed protein product [Vicia faba]|uniref:SAM-dependent methyltransferase RsmB-F/NOP2-type catalytic core domain-containing protein n=1 Tax=Vicia faba TaxID=3906 RepID=A0AAV0ZYW6_VICFA|nr:unnamed protein product [Vicia faba]